jgi:hypothetical protein
MVIMAAKLPSHAFPSPLAVFHMFRKKVKHLAMTPIQWHCLYRDTAKVETEHREFLLSQSGYAGCEVIF